MRVLVVGRDFNDFIINVGQNDIPSDIKFSYLGYSDDIVSKTLKSFYETIWDIDSLVSRSTLMSLQCLFNKRFYHHLFSSSHAPGSYSLKDRISLSLRYAARFNILKEIISDYDVVNIHYCGLDNLQFIEYLKAEQQLVLSWYGSDMYQCSEDEFNIQQRALKRANTIHIQTYNFRTSFLNKYGQQWRSKCFVNLIAPISARYFPSTVNNANSGTIRVLIGNGSGRPMRQINGIISEISKMHHQAKVEYILPLTSGCDESLMTLAKSFHPRDAKFSIIDKFLSDDELFSLQQSVDVYVSIPLYDTLSTTLREMLCLNKICIVGTWNIYGDLVAHGVKMWFVNEVECLSSTLSDIIENIDQYRIACKGNNSCLKIFENHSTYSNRLKKMYYIN